MILFGLSGYARSGKDEAAKALEELGYKRVAFADKLREALVALNPIVDEFLKFPDPIRVADVVREYGWDGYKATEYGDEVRALLQRLGTEVGRNVLGANIWVDAALNNLDPSGRYVVTDCRFPNEFKAVKARGGKVIRISRPGVGPANNHPSETSLDDFLFDAHVNNDGSLEEFHNNIRNLICALV